jgi:hypothetical protein
VDRSGEQKGPRPLADLDVEKGQGGAGNGNAVPYAGREEGKAGDRSRTSIGFAGGAAPSAKFPPPPPYRESSRRRAPRGSRLDPSTWRLV